MSLRIMKTLPSHSRVRGRHASAEAKYMMDHAILSVAAAPSLRETAYRNAFTLVELLVSIAVLAIIMAGVASIFRTAGQTVGMGIAITDQNRAVAAASQQFHQDIIGYSESDPFIQGSGLWPVNEADPQFAPPFLFIRNVPQNSYRDKNAEAAGVTEPFRLDSVGFFTRGAFKRQTGTNELVDLMPVFTRAYIWYGHLRFPDNASGTANPGWGASNTNPYNFYANQWTLGRRAILLSDVTPGTSGDPGRIFDYNNQYVCFYGRDTGGSMTDPTNFAPLGLNAQATLQDSGPYIGSQRVQESRYDIAAMNRLQTWQDYAALIQQYQDGWRIGTYAQPWVERSFAIRHLASPSENIDIDWNLGAIGANKTAFTDAAALAVPVLLRNCTNFVVEFAGDYVDQDPATGVVNSSATFDVTDPATWHLDGVIDYDLIGGRQQIHWYGIARDTNGDGDTTDPTDVNPVRSKRGGNAMPFELDSTGVLYSCGWTRDMLCLPGTSTMTPPLSLAPKLIRITVQVADPQGRVLEDMTRQFVFPVKHN